jgi:DNA-binding transcriptional LysR family regulator
MIEMQHLVHFVALTEAMHFGRAARAIGIAQPALSQSVRRLEERLGIQLLDRSRRRVALTVAGEVFREEARRTLEQAGLAISLARRAAAGEGGRLRVGFVASAQFWLIPPAVMAFRSLHPDTSLEFYEQGSADQIDGLSTGAIDIGILYGTPGEGRELAMRELHRSRMIAVVPKDHRLAPRRSIRLDELASEPFIMSRAQTNPSASASFIAACGKAGFTPIVSQYATLMHTQLCLIASGLGVGVMPDVARLIPVAGLTFLPVSGITSLSVDPLHAAWLPHAETTALHGFVNCLSAAAAAQDHAGVRVV